MYAVVSGALRNKYPNYQITKDMLLLTRVTFANSDVVACHPSLKTVECTTLANYGSERLYMQSSLKWYQCYTTLYIILFSKR